MSDTNAGLPPLEVLEQDVKEGNRLWCEHAIGDAEYEYAIRKARERQLADVLRRLAELEAAKDKALQALDECCNTHTETGIRAGLAEYKQSFSLEKMRSMVGEWREIRDEEWNKETDSGIDAQWVDGYRSGKGSARHRCAKELEDIISLLPPAPTEVQP